MEVGSQEWWADKHKLTEMKKQTSSAESNARAQTEIARNRNQMVTATFKMLAEQQIANKQQQETNDILKSQCEELKRRNDILQEENKTKSKELKHSKTVNWVAIGVSAASLATAILVAIFK